MPRPGSQGGLARPRWEIATGSRPDEQVLSADAVVLAVPARPASRLLAAAAPRAAARLAQIELASMALVSAVLPGAAGLVGSSGSAGSGFLVPPVEGRRPMTTGSLGVARRARNR